VARNDVALDTGPINVGEWIRRLYGTSRPGAARTVAAARIWLESQPQVTDDGKPLVVRWTDKDASHLLFVRYLIERGRLKP
jgi:hypothetical protein